MFDRSKYYSLTDIHTKYFKKISGVKLKKLLEENNIPVIENPITYGNYYSIVVKYYLKKDIDNLLQGI